MPVINGRFYANPAYGLALERARVQEAARGAGHAKPQGQTPPAPNDPLANRIYNESSGLRPTAPKGPGSAQDLHDARTYMGHVIQNREAAKAPGSVAPDHLGKKEAQAVQTYPPAHAAYQDSQAAAERARKGPDQTRGANNFYLDYGQGAPRWARGKALVATFGPFLNQAGGGDVAKGAKTKIVIVR